jgi:predicted nucleic acid-binding protein
VTVLVDSDVIIEVLRGRDQQIVSRWSDLSMSDAAVLCSAVSVAEVWAGARAAEHEAIRNLFAGITCVPIDVETGRQAGDYMRAHGKNHGVNLGDALIAAAAVVCRATLWTRNRKHYPMKELAFF